MTRGRRNPWIDLHLAVLETVRAPGDPLTQVQIADVLGCAPSLVRYYEQKALAKLRRAARRQP